MQENVVDKSFNNLLNRVPKGVADKLREKYEKDSEEFSEAAKAACPSQEPSYWAKRSCNKCYGRGIEGTKYVFPPNTPAKSNGKGGYENVSFTLPLKCSCSDKNYQKWLKEFRKFYNALKEQDEGQNEQE